MFHKIRKYLFITIFFLTGISSFSEVLSSKNADWTNVLGGKALSSPKQTSYGFAVLTDGKMISTCSDKGVKLWEKKVPGHPEPFLTVFSSDFLLTVSDKKNLSLINPSGLCLWTVKVPFTITNEPVPGKDSRIFLKGKKNIACYGVNGICKWTLDTEELRQEELFEMNDGTLLALMTAVENGKTKAVRFSPFGEIVECITFSAFIKSAKAVNGGLLLSFAGGGAGMCTIRDGKAITQWWIPSTDKAFRNTTADSGSSFLFLSENRGVMAVAAPAFIRLMVFSLKDGHVSDFFDMPLKFSEITCFSSSGDGSSVFISSHKKAFLVDSTGKIIWSCDFPSSGDVFAKWNQIFYTKQNSLVLCSTSWAMAGFRVSQKISRKKTENLKKSNYDNFYTINKDYFAALDYSDSIGTKITGTNRIRTLTDGNYGNKEKEYVSALAGFNLAYKTFLMQNNSGARLEQKSIFERDLTGMEEIFVQFNSFGTEKFVKDISYYIKNEKNMVLLTALLRSIKTCGFDPDDSILSAIDNRIQKISPNEKEVLQAICDGVYEICRFMGRPALYNHGIQILTGLIYPQYGNYIQDYARNTLTKIAMLKI